MYLFSLLLTMVIISISACEKANMDNTYPPQPLASLPVKPEIPSISSLPEQPPVLIPLYPTYVGGGGGSSIAGDRTLGDFEEFHFIPNSYKFWTNPNFATTHLLEDCTGSECECSSGEENCEALPAFANILLEPENFVWCKGGPYALCYYSGPADESTDLSCTITADGRFANCNCFEIPWGTYFVDINAILNYGVYQDTINVCGADGSACSGSANINKAPVCSAINTNHLIPGADMVSTFSFDCVPSNGLGQTDCAPNLYAGCMTAPCHRTNTPGIVECSCPIFDGPYQVGSTLLNPSEDCTLEDDLVWSAAYSPSGVTIPPTDPCVPDAPGGNGCPLFNTTMTAPIDTDCEAICEAYACMNDEGIESSYTCDAALCTGQCSERALLEGACQGLTNCSATGLAAIIKLSSEVGCSCCASQLCGCQPNAQTNAAVYDINQRQRDLSIIPQCDINATLCGSPITQTLMQ